MTAATISPYRLKILPSVSDRPPDRRRRGLVVEQPFVGAERAHEPHRVIQRGHHQVLALLEVVDLRRAQQRQVAHVGQRADVQHGVVGQRVAVPEPHLLLGCLGGQPGPAVPAARCGHPTRRTGRSRRRRTRRRTGTRADRRAAAPTGIASWCSIPLWSVWNDADIEKMVCPCWMALTRRVQNDPPSRMRSTRIHRRRPRIARPQEVPVQRVHLEALGSTVRTADTSDWPATWPPKVRCRKPDSGLNTPPR